MNRSNTDSTGTENKKNWNLKFPVTFGY